jgi:hypothetical protein
MQVSLVKKPFVSLIKKAVKNDLIKLTVSLKK